MLLAVCLLWPGWVAEFQSEGPVGIGGMWPLSGPAAFFGKAADGPASLAVDEINEAGGPLVGGKPGKPALPPQGETRNARQGVAGGEGPGPRGKGDLSLSPRLLPGP